MTGKKGVAPKNKIFTDAMLDRMRAFAAAHYPTSTAAVAEMLMDEFNIFLTDTQVWNGLIRYGIKLGKAPPNPLLARPDVIARLRCQVAEQPQDASNAALVALVGTAFGLTVTKNQVARALHGAGISRGGKAHRRSKARIAIEGARPRASRVQKPVEVTPRPEPVLAPDPVETPPAAIQEAGIICLDGCLSPIALDETQLVLRRVREPELCQWPGDIPCAAPQLPGRPYCSACCKIAYVGFKTD